VKRKNKEKEFKLINKKTEIKINHQYINLENNYYIKRVNANKYNIYNLFKIETYAWYIALCLVN